VRVETVELMIDGTPVSCPPVATLADAYSLVPGRRSLARIGCGIGNCEACLVQLNGVDVKACLVVARDGAVVTGPAVRPVGEEGAP
jgi:aerobic-type carbon monoxide dehydrogenase small subunit (CoxS/CutS family)